jgi:hypothetical protein
MKKKGDEQTKLPKRNRQRTSRKMKQAERLVKKKGK